MTETTEQVVARLLNQGLALHRQRRLAEAEALYRAALDHAPQQSQALHFCALAVHQQQGRDCEAESLFHRATAAAPQDAALWSNFGEFCRATGRAGPAREALQRAVTLDPNSAVAHNNLGVLLLGLGEALAAAEAFRAAARLDPAYALASFNLGNALLEADRPIEAVAAFSAALTVQPAFTGARTGLAVALRRGGRLEEAAATLRPAVADGSADARTCRDMAEILMDLGRSAEAEVCWRRALDLNPGDVEARRGLSMTDPAWYEPLLGRRVTLSLAEERDAPFLFSLSAAPDLRNALRRAQVSQGSVDGLAARIATHRRTPLPQRDKEVWVIRAAHNGRPCGMVELSGIDWIHRHAEATFGLPMAEQRRGLGIDALCVLLGAFFGPMAFNKMTFLVYADNPRAARLLEGCGVKLSARLEQHLWDPAAGVFVDCLSYALTRDHFLGHARLRGLVAWATSARGRVDGSA